MTRPGCHTLDGRPNAPGRRAPFEEDRRKEVKQVRNRGACVRCRWGKLPCSPNNPCKKCHRMRSLTSKRRSSLDWMQCVPFSLMDASIYSMDFIFNQNAYSSTLEHAREFMNGTVHVAFEESVHWDLDALAEDFGKWLSDNVQPTERTRRVGILSSQRLAHIMSPALDDDDFLCRDFRLLMKTSAVIHYRAQQPDCFPHLPSFLYLRTYAGVKVVKGLEKHLGKTVSAKTSLTGLKSLFLILCGTIIALNLTKYENCDPIFYHSMSAHAFEEARKHLLRILVHHLIYIADKASLLHREVAKEKLVESASHLWTRLSSCDFRLVSTLKNEPSDEPAWSPDGTEHEANTPHDTPKDQWASETQLSDSLEQGNDEVPLPEATHKYNSSECNHFDLDMAIAGWDYLSYPLCVFDPGIDQAYIASHVAIPDAAVDVSFKQDEASMHGQSASPSNEALWSEYMVPMESHYTGTGLLPIDVDYHRYFDRQMFFAYDL